MRRIKMKAGAGTNELVGEIASAVRAGKLVALPTETVYGLAADPRNPASIARLRAFKGRDADHPFTHHVASREAALALAPPPHPRIGRLVERYWPGPLTLVTPGRDGADIGVRVPAHPFTSRVLAGFEDGLLLSSLNRTGEPPVHDPAAIPDDAPIDILVDAGPCALAEASTVAIWRDQRLEVPREGILAADEVLRAAACSVLFICTGNTCRSPIAEAAARRSAAEALGVSTQDLLARGLAIGSAGLHAEHGAPASENSVTVGAEVGLDLQQHRSRPATAALLLEADLVYGLSRRHVDQIRAALPAIADRVETLSPAGDIPDPFLGDVSVYRQTRDAILAAVAARLPAIVGLLGR